jgi:uncharacterized protein
MKRIMKKSAGYLAALKEKLGNIKADPEKVSLGYAFGVFLASTPFIGLKVFIAIFFTSLFKWSKVSAVIGVFHINLFTAPLFYGFSFLVGRTVLGNSNEFSFPDKVSMVAMLEFFRGNLSVFYSLLLGGLILGIPMAVGAYYLAKSLMAANRGLRPGAVSVK